VARWATAQTGPYTRYRGVTFRVVWAASRPAVLAAFLAFFDFIKGLAVYA
jgi:hypothetical protein